MTQRKYFLALLNLVIWFVCLNPQYASPIPQHVRTRVEVRGHVVGGGGFLLLPCGILGSNSSCTGLAAGAFTHGAISLAQQSNFLNHKCHLPNLKGLDLFHQHYNINSSFKQISNIRSEKFNDHLCIFMCIKMVSYNLQ